MARGEGCSAVGAQEVLSPLVRTLSSRQGDIGHLLQSTVRESGSLSGETEDENDCAL